MRKDLVELGRKLARGRMLLRDQKHRIDRQRELIAHLESDSTNAALVRSERESLRLLIKAHDAILHEVAAAQERTDVRLLIK